MAQMKEQIKALKRERSNEEIANLSDRCTVQNTGNQDAHRMIEYGCKIKEDVKAIQNEIKENVQGTNSDSKATGLQINDLEQKEEIHIQPGQNEETRIQQNERRRKLQDNFKCSNIRMIGVREGEEEEQEMENLFENL